MQQYYTLEEAASKLRMSPDELREMAKSKRIRAFQDRGSWRFRTQDVEELARSRGADSGPELTLGDPASSKNLKRPSKLGKPKPGEDAPTSSKSLKRPSKLGKPKPADEDALAVDFDLDERPGSSKSSRSSGGRSSRPGAATGDSDVKLVMDDDLNFPIEGEPSPPPAKKPRKSKLHPGDSGVRLTGLDRPSDSDVKVVPSATDSAVKPRPAKPASDSDVRLEESEPRGSGKKKKKDDNVVTEELIDLDAEEARQSGERPKPGTNRPRMSQAANAPVLPTDSPFELSEEEFTLSLDDDEDEAPLPPAKAKLKDDTDSSSELIAFDDSKAPGDLGSGEIPLLAGDEDVDLGDLVSGAGAANSGINLDDPGDSGISLEDGEEEEFELSLDSGATPKPQQPAPAPAPATAGEDEDEADSSSEFELSVDDDSSSEFELSVDDDSSSEFELSLDESGGGGGDDSDSSSEFELSLDDSSDAAAGVEEEGSDSEFELTLDDDGDLSPDSDSDSDEAGDLFEPTNFDVPAMEDEDESGSEAVALEEGETDDGDDFEISLDDSESDSESQVVAMDDEEDDADEAAPTIAQPRKTAAKSKTKAKAAAVVEEDEDEAGLDLDLDADADSSAGKKKQKKGKKAGAAAVVEEDEEDDDETEESAVRPAPEPEQPREWGAMPAVMLIPTVLVLFLVAFMGYELTQGMFGYQRPARASKPVVDLIARPVAETVLAAPLPDTQPAKPGN